ncbi:MAG: amidophosphoribosyltransferase [Bacteroidales bacterium]|nr:amidophosphoribosyltransferase [Bacteroidales bacterium]
MEPLKHECGVAMVRLRKPLDYYKQKYGSYSWAISKLYLLMEKQHNRGQEAAGVGVVKLHSQPGNEYVFRERAIGSGAIQEIFGTITKAITPEMLALPAEKIAEEVPFMGEIYMGHLRYSTTGKSGISYVHPFLRRNNWRSRNLLMCGNFNMTNVDDVFERIVRTGQHPRIYGDTVLLLEQLGYMLDKENHRLYRDYRDTLEDPDLAYAIENNLDLERVLRDASPTWDGGYVICGATGSGDMFTLRDHNGIRPAFYYIDDEVVVVASERPVIQTVMNVPLEAVTELNPGQALIVTKNNQVSVKQINEPGKNERCSFERIYFSRGSDADIYRERKALGSHLVPNLLKMLDGDIDKAVFSFIPNTAEVAFMGLMQGLEKYLDHQRKRQIMQLQKSGELTEERLTQIMARKIRNEKIVIKDIKLRTFIAEGASRDELASHVYDVTYGCLNAGEDTLVVIDDSIVRGTTLKQSIIGMLDRLNPKRIVVLSSSPQVRYPDYYGIDMSRMAEFIAFRAAVELLRESGKEYVLREVYEKAVENLKLPPEQQVNCVKEIYAPFTDQEISDQIAKMLTPVNTKAKVDILYQSLDGMHKSIPNHPGDWYFSGDYPTPGGVRQVNRAYVNYYEGRLSDR